MSCPAEGSGRIWHHAWQLHPNCSTLHAKWSGNSNDGDISFAFTPSEVDAEVENVEIEDGEAVGPADVGQDVIVPS